MVQESKITILSTFAKDSLLDRNSMLIREQKGGPAFYIKQALENEGKKILLKTGPEMKVQILLTKNRELGKVLQKSRPERIIFSRINTPFLIISSLLDEFELSNLSRFKGKTFLDIQGYVRNGSNFGKKRYWRPNKEIFTTIFCLKGTREELNYIPTSYIKKQKKKILLTTNSKYGCEVFAFGKRSVFRPSKVINGENTIGAGDTFFAYFVSRFAKTDDAFDAVKYAMNRTSSFLSSQNSHHHNQLFREEIGCS